MPITFGSHVTTCDCRITGRVNMIWPPPKVQNPTPSALKNWPYYRVQFPPCSPFLDDWAVYRAHEIALRIEPPPLTNLNIVDHMRPKVPRV
jgi:hypothetical protein